MDEKKKPTMIKFSEMKENPSAEYGLDAIIYENGTTNRVDLNEKLKKKLKKKSDNCNFANEHK